MSELDIRRHINFISMNEIGEFCKGVVLDDIADEFIEFYIKDIELSIGMSFYCLYGDFDTFLITGETFSISREDLKNL